MNASASTASTARRANECALGPSSALVPATVSAARRQDSAHATTAGARRPAHRGAPAWRSAPLASATACATTAQQDRESASARRATPEATAPSSALVASAARATDVATASATPAAHASTTTSAGTGPVMPAPFADPAGSARCATSSARRSTAFSATARATANRHPYPACATEIRSSATGTESAAMSARRAGSATAATKSALEASARHATAVAPALMAAKAPGVATAHRTRPWDSGRKPSAAPTANLATTVAGVHKHASLRSSTAAVLPAVDMVAATTGYLEADPASATSPSGWIPTALAPRAFQDSTPSNAYPVATVSLRLGKPSRLAAVTVRALMVLLVQGYAHATLAMQAIDASGAAPFTSTPRAAKAHVHRPAASAAATGRMLPMAPAAFALRTTSAPVVPPSARSAKTMVHATTGQQETEPAVVGSVSLDPYVNTLARVSMVHTSVVAMVSATR